MTAAGGLADSFDRLTEQISGFRSELTELQKDLKNSKRRGVRAIVGSYSLWVLDIAIITAGLIYGSHVASVSECQARQNDAFRAASVASRQARENQDNQTIAQLDQQIVFLDTIVNPAATLDQRRAATLAYRKSALDNRASIVQAKQSRKDNPLPAGNCS